MGMGKVVVTSGSKIQGQVESREAVYIKLPGLSVCANTLSSSPNRRWYNLAFVYILFSFLE